MISRAQASSAAVVAPSGRQTKIRSRIGVDSGTRPLNGPEMKTVSIPGMSVDTLGDGAESVKATDTRRVPASSGTVISSAWSAVMRYSWSRWPSTSSSGTAINWPGSGPGYSPPMSKRSIRAWSTRTSIWCASSPIPSMVSIVSLRFRRMAKV